MTSYNQLDGEWAGQNSRVIGELLRGELGFRGCVMSDWGSVYDTEKVVRAARMRRCPAAANSLGRCGNCFARGAFRKRIWNG